MDLDPRGREAVPAQGRPPLVELLAHEQRELAVVRQGPVAMDRAGIASLHGLATDHGLKIQQPARAPVPEVDQPVSFYARLPDVKGTAGTAAIMSDEVLHARAAYEWTLNHVIEVADPRELFRARFETVRAGAGS